jgi:serine/threonine protein kinase
MQQSFFEAKYQLNNDKASIKEFHLPHYPKNDQRILKEILILPRLSHPCVPLVRECFVTDKSIYLATDHIEQTRLHHTMHNFQAQDMKNIMNQLFDVTRHCHERGVIIRDLSPMNISITKVHGKGQQNAVHDDYLVKIADFSLAVEMGVTESLADHPQFSWEIVKYSAPELILSKPYTICADMWTLGVVLYEMLSRGRLPFHHPQDHILVRNIAAGAFSFQMEIWEEVPEDAKHLVEQLIKVTPWERLAAKDCLENEWIKA